MNGAAHNDGGGNFPTTEWTLIVKAIQGGDEALAQAALERFCERYRPAIVNFFRKRGQPERAEDRAQEFFLVKIHRPWADRAGLLFDAERRPNKRFRSFLATALHRFLIDQWRKLADPSDTPVSVEEVPEVAHAEAIGNEIDRSLAVQTILEAINRAKPSPLLLKFWNGEISQKAAAEELGQSEDAFTQSYARFRQRVRRELRTQVAEMIGESEDVDAEIKYFLSLFAGTKASLPQPNARNAQ